MTIAQVVKKLAFDDFFQEQPEFHQKGKESVTLKKHFWVICI